MKYPRSTSGRTRMLLDARWTVPVDFGRMFAERRLERPVRRMSASVQIVADVHKLDVDASRSEGSFGKTTDLSLRRYEGMNVDAVWKG